MPATMMSISELMTVSGLSRNAISRLIKSGDLVAIDVSKNPGTGRPTYRIEIAEWERFKRSREVVQKPKVVFRRRKRHKPAIEFYK